MFGGLFCQVRPCSTLQEGNFIVDRNSSLTHSARLPYKLSSGHAFLIHSNKARKNVYNPLLNSPSTDPRNAHPNHFIILYIVIYIGTLAIILIHLATILIFLFSLKGMCRWTENDNPLIFLLKWIINFFTGGAVGAVMFFVKGKDCSGALAASA